LRLAALIGLLVALFAPAAAHAAGKPFALDARDVAADPHVAVDENGVGHFAWNEERPFVSSENPGDDLLRYCQVPRNGTACTKPATIAIPEDDFEGPRVLLPGDGRVLIITQRCCGGTPSLDLLWVVESLDGGLSWGAPRKIGTVAPSGDAELGPGEFSVSVISSIVTGGTFFQAAPLDDYTGESANVGDAGAGVNNPFAYGDVAFPDPLTPVTVMTDLDTVYFRRWSGAGNYNDLGSWGPLQEYGPGDETEAVDGPRGVFMTYKTEDFPRQFRMARWGGMAFGASSPVTPRGDPIFADFFQDRGGNLHFLWQENGPDELRHRMSRDGQTWAKAEVLADDDDGGLYNLGHATARDGGGFAVWDENGQGPVKAVQFGPTGPVKDLPQDNACVLELKVGSARIAAREGCLKKQAGTQRYRSKGDVRVNGIDLETSGALGSSAAPAAKATVVIDKEARTLRTEGKVLAKVGNIVLDRKELEWRLPQAVGPITDLAGNPASFDTASFGIELLGLPVSGKTSPTLTKNGGVAVPVHLELPEPFGGLGGLGDITGDITLEAHVETGLKLADLVIQAKNIGIGIATIEDLLIEYVGDPNKLFGRAKLALPVLKGEIDAEWQLLDGEFDYAKGIYTVTPPSPGIPVATSVFLRQIGFAIETDPTKLSGFLGLTGLGQLFGTRVLELNGLVSYTFPDSPAPGIFDLKGTGKVVGLGVGSAFFRYETTGKATFGGAFEIGNPSVLGIKGAAGGGADLQTKQFDLFGEADGCGLGICASNDWIVSSKAAAICLAVDTGAIGEALGGDPAITVVYEWDDGLDAFAGCDLSGYKAVSSARVAQDGSRTFRLDGGMPLAGVEVIGQGAPPRVTITGPDGQTIATPADQSQPVNTEVGLLVADPADDTTIAVLRAPQKGTWTVTPQDGSVPITALRTADGIPAPRVKAKVRGRGLKRTLDYTVRQIPGQVVRFVEEGRGAYEPIGRAKGRAGSIKFTPANGARGKRRILALVDQNGLPRDRLAVATYKAPGLIRPARPKRVRLNRRGNRLVVRWRRAARAHSYIVRAVLRDGRQLTIPSRRTRVRIRNFPGIDSARVNVHGVTREGVIGPADRAKIKPKPKPKKRKRGRR